MQTNIVQTYLATPEGKEAEAILRSCVHCGFCTATCPTYQELSDERDGPRGRIYLIKQLLETDQVTDKTRTHLDRCLTCRSCETTCPSGVQYGRLLDIGRGIVEKKLERPFTDRLVRWVLRQILPNANRFGPLLRFGQAVKPILPSALANKIPRTRKAAPWPESSHPRVMVALAGCAQPSAAPNTNAAAARVLDKLGITLVEAQGAGCCGAVNHHLSAQEAALGEMRRNIDAWWPAVEAGCQAIVITASGCGAMVQEYGHLLRDDPAYASKAKRVSALAKDISDILLNEDLSVLKPLTTNQKVAVHCPCTLQHAMRQGNRSVETILVKVGFEIAATKDTHLCCGSAGTYSILQPKMAKRLLANKVDALTFDNPTQIVTSNIGCQLHIETEAPVPVNHWIELLDC